MLLKLGNMMRWMMLFHQQIVYLEDELEYNDSYLSLQRLRYADSFDSEIRVPEELLYLGIPKFTIQPIVENALVHGLQENGMSGTISIDVQQRGRDLQICVSDNGMGMAPDVLARLRAHITKQQKDPSFGIGMQNVHSRIQMLFGNAYGIAIDSTRSQGTAVTITLPAIPKKEMEQLVSTCDR